MVATSTHDSDRLVIISADRTVTREPNFMAKWDAREWLAGLMGLEAGDLTVRSTDRYGSEETQVRYEQDGLAVARLTVKGPVREMLEKEGEGLWLIKAQIGSGTSDVHSFELPETEEVVY
jgi:hypothetical protein